LSCLAVVGELVAAVVAVGGVGECAVEELAASGVD
jgi:hypothetical protein